LLVLVGAGCKEQSLETGQPKQSEEQKQEQEQEREQLKEQEQEKTKTGTLKKEDRVESIEADSFYYPFCRTMVNKNPQVFGKGEKGIQACAKRYTINEKAFYNDCIQEEDVDFCQQEIKKSRQVFSDCVSGKSETPESCWGQ